MAGLFGTLNIATRGMFAQQKAIDVTSHNIANANTEGYSRQRAVIKTSTPFAMPALNNTAEPGQTGTGAQVTAIERYRDSFLDYQTRVETSTKGQYDTKESLLGQVESIINEPSDTGISALMGKFFDAWQQLSKQPSSSNARTVVAQQSAALADDLNSKFTQLTKLKENVQTETKNAVVDINSMLTQINTLNQQIVGVGMSGNQANDLMDKRDLLLDQLSSKFNINVTNSKMDGVDVAPADITGAGISSPNMINSVITGNEKKLSYISDVSVDPANAGQVQVTYYSNGDMTNAANKHILIIKPTVPETVQSTIKALDDNRVLWTDSATGFAVNTATSTGIGLADNDTTTPITIGQLSQFQPTNGEIKGYADVQVDVDSYIDQLNSVAKALALSVNAIHSGMADPNPAVAPAPPAPSYDGMPFFVNSDKASYTNNILTNLLDSAGPPAVTGTLTAENSITAGNISINKEILADVMKIKTRTNDDQYLTESANVVDGESDGARALAIASVANSLLLVQNIGSATTRADLFGAAGTNPTSNNGMTISDNTNGSTVESYYKDTVDTLGIQSQEAQRMVTNQDSLLSSFEESRASISGVSLDEEMANLVQFQHAYQANAKVISTLDSLLDVVVNGLKK